MFIHWRIGKLPIRKMKLLFKSLNVTWLVGAFIFTLLFLSGCSFLPKEEPVLAPPLAEPPQLDYRTAEVKRGEIIKSVKGTGALIPKNNHDLQYTKDGYRLKSINVYRGDEVKKGQLLAELDTGNLIHDIEQMKLEVKKAELRLKQIQNYPEPDKYAVEIAKLDLQGLKNRLSLMNRQLSEARIYSPIDGIVTFVANINEGDYVTAYQSILQVADPSELQLQYRATNIEDIADVTVGMEAKIEIGEETVVGEVVQTPKTVPSDVAKVDPDFYNRAIFIDIPEVPEEAKVGDMLSFEVITARAEDTLIIPRNTLRSIIGRNYVQLMVDNTKREVDIQVGIISSTEVEVLQGLEEGDKVIIR